MIAIDKEVPLPAQTGSGTPVYPWPQMEIGDSFAIPLPAGSSHSVRRAAAAWGASRDKKFTCRICEENGARVIRVWRTA